MTARKIPIAWVHATIQHPERIALDADPAFSRAWRRIPERGGRWLRVVFRRSERDIVVVSAMFDQGARRWLP